MITVVEHGWVVPVDGKQAHIEDGSVAFEDDRIVGVGPAAEIAARFKADRTVDARGKAILPGFINTHIHMIGGLNKGLTEDLSGVSGGLFKIAMPLHYVYAQAPEVYWLASMHALECVRTGTTTVNEMGKFEREVAKVVRDVGLRAVMAENIRDSAVVDVRPGVVERTFVPADAERCIDAALAFIEEWHGEADGRITCRLGPNAPDTCAESTLLRVKELADQRGLGLHTHLAQVPGEREYVVKAQGRSPVKYLADLGYLNASLVAAHCVFMSEEDAEQFAASGAHMSHTAYLVGKRGYFPPMQALYKHKASVALGSDWLSNDMFKIMRSAILLARQQAGSVAIVDGPKALEMATMGGARALGMEREIGSLEPGKKADLILLDMEAPWVNPIRPAQLVSNIVYNANGSDVTDVYIDGREVVVNRRAVQIDGAEARRECQATAERVWARASSLFAGA
jgi:5-methylthioadenosine/S-adenosylhomocysteine deaminase